MHLLNAAVAATAVLVGTTGATVAYGSLNTPPFHPDVPEQETVYVLAPCDPPAVLTDGICVTTVVKTVVKKEKPKVITIVEPASTSKSSSKASHGTKRERHHDDDGHEDDHDDHEHGEDDDD